MANIKCSKCGVEFPDWASFCPGCGTPKAAATPAPVYHQVPKSANPFEGIFNMAFSKTVVILVVSIGVLLAWFGQLVLIFATQRTDIATLLYSVGFAAIGLFLVSGGIWNHKIDKFVRFAMVIMGVFILMSLFSSFSASNILQNIYSLYT